MARNPNTNTRGESFDEKTVEAVWRKATEIPGYPSFRTDTCGAMIQREKHGKIEQYGWEVDHKKAVAKGPKKGKRGYVDEQDRIWVKDRSHAGLPDHWDVQINEGEDYFRVDQNGDEVP